MTNVNLSSGLPETVLPPEPADVVDALAAAGNDRAAVAAVAARHPRSLTAWATLGDLGRDEIERYACYRVGYHRGLDTLRANGWRGSGYVRWAHPENRGFLRALDGLSRAAAALGEAPEVERAAAFRRQLDPDWAGLGPADAR